MCAAQCIAACARRESERLKVASDTPSERVCVCASVQRDSSGEVPIVPFAEVRS